MMPGEGSSQEDVQVPEVSFVHLCVEAPGDRGEPSGTPGVRTTWLSSGHLFFFLVSLPRPPRTYYFGTGALKKPLRTYYLGTWGARV